MSFASWIATRDPTCVRNAPLQCGESEYVPEKSSVAPAAASQQAITKVNISYGPSLRLRYIVCLIVAQYTSLPAIVYPSHHSYSSLQQIRKARSKFNRSVTPPMRNSLRIPASPQWRWTHSF